MAGSRFVVSYSAADASSHRDQEGRGQSANRCVDRYRIFSAVHFIELIDDAVALNDVDVLLISSRQVQRANGTGYRHAPAITIAKPMVPLTMAVTAKSLDDMDDPARAEAT